MIVNYIKGRAAIKVFLFSGILMVWLINGLYCKVLNFVPRHEMIVSHILGHDYSALATRAIGVSEIFMVVWIISRIKPRLCAWAQITVVALMNIIEFILVPDLLLFGRWNIVFASCFVGLVYLNEFVFNSNKAGEHISTNSM